MRFDEIDDATIEERTRKERRYLSNKSINNRELRRSGRSTPSPTDRFDLGEAQASARLGPCFS